MKARFSPQIIGELRHRVIHHNSLLRDAGAPELLMKLGALKGLYQRWYGGKNPHEHALNKIDDHLAALRDGLAKAEARDPATGKFESSGSGPVRNQREFYGDVAGADDHRALAAENAGYDAAQTQVIPETRYSTFGPNIAGAAALVTTGLLGATASLKGSPVDKAITTGLGFGGKKTGALAGNVAGHAIRGAAKGVRQGIGLVNRHAHTTYARPSATAGTALHEVLKTRGAKLGEAAGRGLGHTQAFVSNAPGVAGRRATEYFIPGRRGRILGRLAGGALTMGTIGAFSAAPAAYQFASNVGPYLDTAFPRRVRKSIEILLDAPEVLAKRDELLADELAKASLRPAIAAVTAATRKLAAGARRVVSILRPSVASHSVGPQAGSPTLAEDVASGKNTSRAARLAVGRGSAAGRKAYEAAEQANAASKQPFSVRRLHGVAAYDVATHAVPLGLAGAGVGAIAGAAGVGGHDYLFADKHPRDPHGRFATKTKGAVFGAKLGGAVGLGVGLIAGLSAARLGRTAVLSDALSNLARATPEMQKEAEKTARTVHATAWMDAHKNLGKQPPNSPTPLHEHVKTEIERAALKGWREGEGKALSLTPRQWYEKQIDDAFTADTLPKLQKLADLIPGTTRPKPLLATDGSSITRSTAANFADRVDVGELNTAQRKIWDDQISLRDKAHAGLKQVYQKHADDEAVWRAARKVEIDKRDALWAEEEAIDARVGPNGSNLERDSYATIKAWAKRALNHDAVATTKKDLLVEVSQVLERYRARSQADIAAADAEMTLLTEQIKHAQQRAISDVDEGERWAVKDPFHRGKTDRYFRAKPAIAEEETRIKDAASKTFVEENDLHARAAREHLNNMVLAQQISLEGRLPTKGLSTRMVQWLAPRLAPHMQQGMEDYKALTTARYSRLSDRQKKIYDWVHAQKNPAKAYETLKKLSDDAAATGKKYIRWGARNAKTISSIVGLLSAVGAIDLSGPKGKRVRIDPKNWQRPKDLDIVREMPNPLDRPHEIVLGLSHRDKRDNQQKFLTGIYVKNENGDYDTLANGASVEQVRSLVRNRGNQQGGQNRNQQTHQAEKVAVEDENGLKAAITRLNAAGFINQMGPPPARYRGRTGGDPGKAEKDWADKFYQAQITRFNLERYGGQSTNNSGRYYTSLKTLFESDGNQILSPQMRVNLLVGGGPFKRGIFANKGFVYKHPPGDANKAKVAAELANQIGIHAPGTNDEYRQLHRAVDAVAAYYVLTPPEVNQVHTALELAFQKSAGTPPPAGPDSGAAGSLIRVQDAVNRALQIPRDQRMQEADSDMRIAAAAAYQARLRVLRERPDQFGQMTEDELHEDAVARMLQQLTKDHAAKSDEADGSLRKFLSWKPSDSADGSAPPIAGAANGPPALSAHGPPALSAHEPPALSARRGAKLGNYALGQGAYDAAAALGNVLLPGGGAVRNLARVAASGYAGVKGGRAFGDTSQGGRSEAGSTAGQVAGLGTQAATMHFGHKAFDRMGQQASSALGRGAGRVAQAMPAGVQAGAGRLGQAAGEAASTIKGAALRGAAAIPRPVVNAAAAVARGTGKVVGGIDRFAARVASPFTSRLGNAAAQTAGKDLVVAGGRNVVATAGEGAAEGFGRWLGSKFGTAAGEAAGTVAEPGGGTLAGGIAGRAIGAAVGAGAGWLADEGVGFLYDHLSGYGPQAADIAAQSMGVHPAVRRKYAQRALAGPQQGGAV